MNSYYIPCTYWDYIIKYLKFKDKIYNWNERFLFHYISTKTVIEKGECNIMIKYNTCEQHKTKYSNHNNYQNVYVYDLFFVCFFFKKYYMNFINAVCNGKFIVSSGKYSIFFMNMYVIK